MEDFESVNWLSYKVFKGDLKSISFKNKILINTINQYSYCIAEKDSEFKAALVNSDILLPDGIAIVVAIRQMLGLKIKKVAGADIHSCMLNACYKSNGSCFYLGSSEHTLSEIKNKLDNEYPGMRVGFYSPPYKIQFTAEDNQAMLNAVDAFKPDVLFVGMTAPKQEKWANEFKQQINAHVICTIGAVFDFYAGTVARPDKIWIDLGLEWFIRLLKEPARMWKRYIYYGPVFILKMFQPANKNI